MRELVEKYRAHINKTDDNGNTALMAAARAGEVDAVKYLLSRKGINVNHANQHGDIALDFAHKAPKNEKKIARTLKTHGGITGLEKKLK